MSTDQKQAPSPAEASDPFGTTHDGVVGALVLDVRRQTAFDKATTMIAGALRYDPALVDQWATTLPTDRPMVVYCVHGHEVSQNAAKALRDIGLNAKYLLGGVEGWQAAGKPLQTKEVSS